MMEYYKEKLNILDVLNQDNKSIEIFNQKMK